MYRKWAFPLQLASIKGIKAISTGTHGGKPKSDISQVFSAACLPDSVKWTVSTKRHSGVWNRFNEKTHGKRAANVNYFYWLCPDFSLKMNELSVNVDGFILILTTFPILINGFLWLRALKICEVICWLISISKRVGDGGSITSPKPGHTVKQDVGRHDKDYITSLAGMTTF